METYILIVILQIGVGANITAWHSNSLVTMQEFSSQAKCETAAAIIRGHTTPEGLKPFTQCVEK